MKLLIKHLPELRINEIIKETIKSPMKQLIKVLMKQ